MKSYMAKDLKNLNRKTIYQCIVDSAEQTVSCAQVARETGISMPTALKVAEYFVQKGLLLDLGECQNNAIGRRPTMLRFNPDAFYAAGCAYNGRYLEVALVNMNSQVISANRIRAAVPVAELFAETLPAALNALVRTSSLKKEGSLVGIGIALPVIMDGKQRCTQFPAPLIGIKNSFDFSPFCTRLEERYRCTVHLENDVNAAALGEFKERGLTKRNDMVYITVGTGVGSGVILGGHLRRGQNNTAGEIGNMTFDLGSKQWEDGLGYLEYQLTLPYLERHFSYHPLNELEDADAEIRLRVARHVADHLALSILNMNAVLDIDLFVLGGFVVDRLDAVLLPLLRERLEGRCLNPVRVERETSQFTTAKGMGSVVMEQKLDDILSGDLTGEVVS